MNGGKRSGFAELDDPALAVALAAGDEEALAELYNRYGGLAYSTALRIVGDSAGAEDVVQEAFLKLWNNASHFATDRGSLRTWLTTAVRHRAIDQLRGKSGHNRDESELTSDLRANESIADPWHGVAASAKQVAVRNALDGLPLKQRLALELAYFGSFSQPEIARMMGVSLGTVKGRTRLGLRSLSSRLTDRRLLESWDG